MKTEMTPEQILQILKDANNRIKVSNLGLDQTTPEGRWFAKVDGEVVGQGGRSFWKSRYQAWRCGWNNLKAKLGVVDDKF